MGRENGLNLFLSTVVKNAIPCITLMIIIIVSVYMHLTIYNCTLIPIVFYVQFISHDNNPVPHL